MSDGMMVVDGVMTPVREPYPGCVVVDVDCEELPVIEVDGAVSVTVTCCARGYLIGNYVGGRGSRIHSYRIAQKSATIPFVQASALAIGTAVMDAIDFDESHQGFVTRPMSHREIDEMTRLVGGASGRSRACELLRDRIDPTLGLTDPVQRAARWVVLCEVPSLRGTGTDDRIDAGTIHVSLFDGAERLGEAVQLSLERTREWCAANGRNPYSGRPVPLTEDLGAAGLVTLTPPAFFEEEYERGTGVVREYFRNTSDTSLPSKAERPDWYERWYEDWAKTLVGWITWRRSMEDDDIAFQGAWKAKHGKPLAVVSEACPADGECGCFTSRGVLSNKSWETEWYCAPLFDGSVLELRLDIKQPGRRGKMAGKMHKAFEKCAASTSIAPPGGNRS